MERARGRSLGEGHGGESTSMVLYRCCAAGSVDWGSNQSTGGKDQPTGGSNQSTGGQVQSTGDQTSRLVTHQGSSTCCSTHVIGREVMECLDWHESKYSRATEQGSSGRMICTPLICARCIRLKIDMSEDSWSTGGKSCGVTTNSCRSSGPRRYMAWRSCGLFDFANSCCPVYGLVNSQERNKLEAKSRLIGFTIGVKGFIL